jgi:predicted ATPase
MFECFAAMALFALGHPDQSARRLSAGLELARDLGHPQTLVVAQHIAAQIHQLRGEAAPSYQLAKQATELASEYGLELWRAYGIIEMGWAEAEMGNVERGIEQIQRGLALHESMGSKLRLPYFLGLLADQFAKAGRVEEGLVTIGTAIAVSEHTGERFLLPELYRINGELFLSIVGRRDAFPKTSNPTGGSNAVARAQSCFTKALAIATEQHATSLESKIVASMERLKHETTPGNWVTGSKITP